MDVRASVINQLPVRKTSGSKVKLKTKTIFLPLFPGCLFGRGLKKNDRLQRLQQPEYDLTVWETRAPAEEEEKEV